MAAVQSIPDDEIAAELAASWDPDDGPAPMPAAPAPARPWRPTGPQDLAQAVLRTRPVSMRHEQGLPVIGALTELLPAGLPRGAVVAVDSRAGGTSLALALAVAPAAAGSWVAVVGLPAVGLAAAAGLGISLERVVVVQTPPPDRWATAVGALVGAFDIVLVAPPPRVRAAEGRRLAARARERGAVLVSLGVGLGSPGSQGSPGSSVAADAGDPVLSATVRLRVVEQRWFGVGEGHGHLQRRWARVELDGRRQAARPRRVDLWLPDESGQVRALRLDEQVEPAPIEQPTEQPLEQPIEHVRRQRIRRVARRPLAQPIGAEADRSWSDAG